MKKSDFLLLIWNFDPCTVKSISYCVAYLIVRRFLGFIHAHTDIYKVTNNHFKHKRARVRFTPTILCIFNKRNLICTSEITNSKINFKDFIRIIYMWYKLFKASFYVYTEKIIHTYKLKQRERAGGRREDSKFEYLEKFLVFGFYACETFINFLVI